MGPNSVCTSDNKSGRPRSGSPICLSRIRRNEVLLPINHKKYNFREKKNSQVMKERENLHKKLTRGDVNILWPPRLPLIISRQKHKSKCACTHACTRNYNFESDWLITTALNVIGLLNCPITKCSIRNFPIITWQVN